MQWLKNAARSRALAALVLLAALPLCPARAGEPEDEKAPPPNPAHLVAGIVRPTSLWPQREALARQLVQQGDAAVSATESALLAQETEQDVAFFLVKQLGAINTSRSVQALRKVLPRADRVAHRALNQLSQMDSPAAQNAILNYRPPNEQCREVHAICLYEVPGVRALELLAAYLLDESALVSGRARQMLDRRLRKRADDQERTLIVGLLAKMLDELDRREDLKEHIHIREALAGVARGLPRDEQIRWLAKCLEHNDMALGQSAVTVLRRLTGIVAEREILDSLAGLVNRPGLPAQTRINLLDLLQRGKAEQGGPRIAAQCVYHPERAVVLKAVEVLEKLTGKALGRNPEPWKQYAVRQSWVLPR